MSVWLCANASESVVVNVNVTVHSVDVSDGMHLSASIKMKFTVSVRVSEHAL